MLRAFLILIIGGGLLSCVLTPPVFSALQLLLGEVPWPYSRVFDRVALVVACGLAYALRKHLQLASLWPHYRSWRRRGEWRRLVLGAALTCSATLLAVPFLVRSGALAWDPEATLAGVLRKAVTFLPAALLIATLEESFFRVLVFEKLRAAAPTVIAALAASLFYAVLHFVSPEKSFEYTGWSPTVGFEYLAAVGTRLLLPGVDAGVLGLTLIGLVLCYALRRTGSLGLCIGLHGGWVLAAKLAMKLTDRVRGNGLPTGAGSRNFLVTRPEAWGSILVCLGVLWILTRRPRERRGVGDTAEG